MAWRTVCRLRPVVDSVYPLADIASAHQAFERGGVAGKQAVEVAKVMSGE
ncbi:zinc-binding dehydrogenase [Streptomyces kronopolitis]